MGQKLLKFFISVFFTVSALLTEGYLVAAWSQISLEDEAPLEVRFTQGETERNQLTISVGLSDIHSILSENFIPAYDQWIPFEEKSDSEVNIFVSENGAEAAPGRLKMVDSQHHTFFVTSFRNNTSSNIGNVILAYDFLHNFQDQSPVHNFKLIYKVNEGEWTQVPSGIISSASLKSNENTWNSFSIQLNIDDIFLRPSDTVDLMWVIEEETTTAQEIPMALQRVEIDPQFAEQHSLERGDIIITEILPKSKINGTDFEYFEIYNPGEERVSLKGVEIFTSLGSKVIQKDLYVDPYDFTVISNVDLSGLESVRNSYFYNGTIINEQRGRVGLERGGKLIASATYEAIEPGLALELNKVSSSFDGYTSLQDFNPSQTTYFQDLYGSPGFKGTTVPMYKKVLKKEGYYLLNLPGVSVQRLNRFASLDIFSIRGEMISLDVLDPHVPFLVHKKDDEPAVIYAEPDAGTGSVRLPVYQLTTGSDFVANQEVTSGTPSAEKTPSVSAVSPVIQYWNPETHKFEINFSNTDENNIWQPTVLNRELTNVLSTSDRRMFAPALERYVEFTLVLESEENRLLPDLALLGFLDPPTQQSQLRYDLPKLELVSEMQTENLQQPLLFLSSVYTTDNYHAFTHLPYEIRDSYEIGLGTRMPDQTGTAVLKWNLVDDIPEEWIMQIEDRVDGTSIDMREVSEYRFRYSNSQQSVDDQSVDDSPQVVAIDPEESPRFVIKIEPYESFVDSKEEQETPDRIELRPNYPNPFNPSTNINFYLPEERTVRLGVYNIVGQQVALLLDDTVQPGEHSLVWDASDKPSGIYIVQLETGNRIFTRKITLIK